MFLTGLAGRRDDDDFELGGRFLNEGEAEHAPSPLQQG